LLYRQIHKGGLYLNINQEGPKRWSVSHDGERVTLQLSPSSITNKFFIVTKYIENVSKFCGKEFDEWFIGILKAPKTIVDNVDKLKEFSDAYLTSQNFDYSIFVDESKAKKNSILFRDDEIEKVIRLSCYLKIYSTISNSENLKLTASIHREVYNKIAIDALKSEVVTKIYDVIKTKTYRYSMTDKFMWEYIKSVRGKDLGAHVIEIFNFIMNNILVLCEDDKNPITYFVGVIDESVKWFLHSVYKDAIIYDDSIATEDIQGINTDNLKTYSYNDTLGRLKKIAYERVKDILESKNIMKTESDEATENYLVEFSTRLEEIEFISPLCETLVYPILSEMTSIPFNHLRTLSPEHAALLSVYIQEILKKTFPAQYRETFTLLEYYPTKSPSISTTYKIKSVHDYLDVQDDTQNFYGFKAKILPHDILCHFVGRIARVNLRSILTGRDLAGIPLSKVEREMIIFYTHYFAGEFKDKIKYMTQLMNADF
jgi:hypothetical protein